jgi:hypothetical protein
MRSPFLGTVKKSKDANEVQNGSMLFCAVVGYSWTEEDWPREVTPETLESEEIMAKVTLHCFILLNRSMSKMASSMHDEAVEQEKAEDKPQSAQVSHEGNINPQFPYYAFWLIPESARPRGRVTRNSKPRV